MTISAPKGIVNCWLRTLPPQAPMPAVVIKHDLGTSVNHRERCLDLLEANEELTELVGPYAELLLPLMCGGKLRLTAALRDRSSRVFMLFEIVETNSTNKLEIEAGQADPIARVGEVLYIPSELESPDRRKCWIEQERRGFCADANPSIPKLTVCVDDDGKPEAYFVTYDNPHIDIEGVRERVPEAFRHAPLDGDELSAMVDGKNDHGPIGVNLDVLEIIDLDPNPHPHDFDNRWAERGTDTLGMYLSFHLNKDYWGIYLCRNAIHACAKRLCARLASQGCKDSHLSASRLIEVLVVEHEYVHHFVDSLLVRQEKETNVPLYLPYKERVRPFRETPEWLEEALANYVAREKVLEECGAWEEAKPWTHENTETVKRFIDEMYEKSPSGYRDWRLFEEERMYRRFVEQLLGNNAIVDASRLEAMLKNEPLGLRNRQLVPIRPAPQKTFE